MFFHFFTRFSIYSWASCFPGFMLIANYLYICIKIYTNKSEYTKYIYISYLYTYTAETNNINKSKRKKRNKQIKMEHITNGDSKVMYCVAGGVLVGAAAMLGYVYVRPKPAACDGSGLRKVMVLL